MQLIHYLFNFKYNFHFFLQNKINKNQKERKLSNKITLKLLNSQ